MTTESLRTYADDEQHQQQAAQHGLMQSESPSASPPVSSDRGPWRTGGIALGIAALLLALIAWYTRLKRPKDKALDTDAHRRKAPMSEADLDNTVRTLTEQRLSDGSTSMTMQDVCIRQPASSCWQPHGVGQVSCPTKVAFQQSKQRKGQVISGPAAMELMRLQLQYLIFLKQSDAASSLTQEPQQYIKL
ncbi:TPA: hypothetical protein ACH3X1_005774 [Trebouxia sp. C0004]